MPGAVEYDFTGELPMDFSGCGRRSRRIFRMTGKRAAADRAGKPGVVVRAGAGGASAGRGGVYEAECEVVADPPNWQRAAGLITYYNRHKFHAALVTREAANGWWCWSRAWAIGRARR